VSGETIAFFTKNRTNPAYDAGRLGADRAAALYGARVVHFMPARPDDIAEQIELVEQAIAGRPDVVVFAPVDMKALDASVRKINEAGIPVVNYLNRMSAGRFVGFVGSDDRGLAHDIAAYLFRHLGGKGEVAMMEGVPGAITSRDRVSGFLEAAREWPGIRVVATPPGDYQEATARQVMTAFLAGAPRVDGILAANDVMALGILDALHEAGRTAPVVGVNALPGAIAAIKSGRMLATVDFDAMKICGVATEMAIRHLRGEPVPAEITLPVQIVDRSNCEPWDCPIEQRAYPGWAKLVGNQRR
jgi:ribose transport system substrate-binding protein